MSVIFGGLSLLNLIVDLSPISLNGKLLEWSKAYDALVESFVRPLFAWIHLYWISISTGEMHLLVIQSILIAGYIRASLRWGYVYEISELIFNWAYCMQYVLIPALILPGLGGLLGAIGGLLFVNFEIVTTLEPNDIRMALEELTVIIFLVCFLIAMNYTLFAQNRA